MTANINDKVTRHVFSYYYGNDIKDARKIRLQSLLNDPNLKLSNSKLDFILDTGATNVLFPAQLAGITISEQYFIKNIDHKIENHSGIVSTSPIVYYRCLLDTFQ